MNTIGFGRPTLRFLADLEKHNDRDWFHEHRDRYEEHCLEPARRFVVALGERLRERLPELKFEPKVNASIQRQARDARFARDGPPYRDELTLRFWTGPAPHAGPVLLFRLGAKNLRCGGGIHAFAPHALAAYRDAVLDRRAGPALEKILRALRRRRHTWREPHYKRVPRGLPDDHPRADLLRRKGLFAYRDLDPPADLSSARFIAACANRLLALAPLLAWLDDLG